MLPVYCGTEREPEDLEITRALYRGMQCGVRYAEGFITANEAFRLRPYRLLP
jgi:hypothetical protein